MVIKGSSRGQTGRDCRRLAEHLLNGEENERVELVGLRGAVAADLHGALREWRAVSLGSRTRRCLYHASINVGRDELARMDRRRWAESVEALERRLHLQGRPRAVVAHEKHGRRHLHVVWLRVDPQTLKANCDSHTYRIHELTSRDLEARFGLRPVAGVHTRPNGAPRPVAAATHEDQQAAARTGVAVAEVAAAIRGAWREAEDGPGFAAGLERRGLSLETGRRGLIVVDAAGTPHSIARRLGIKAAAVREKLKGLNEAAIPLLADTKTEHRTRRTSMKEKKETWGMAARGPTSTVDWDALEAWWRNQGFDPVRQWDCLVIDAFGATWRDFGDRVEVAGTGEPTDEQIEAMVRAGRERGWSSIHFYGGTESFQRRARLEALRQGFAPSRITLECEEGRSATAPTAQPLPEHLKRTLGLPAGPDGNIDTMPNPEIAHELEAAPRI